MNNRYLAWTLLIAACGLQAYLVKTGTIYFNELQLFLLPRLFPKGSAGDIYWKYLMSVQVLLLNFVLPAFLTFLAWIFLGLKKRFGWNLALFVDFYFGVPMLAMCSLSVVWNLRHPHTGLQHSDDPARLVTLAALHILLLCSPPIRALFFPPLPQDVTYDFPLITTSAR